MHPETVFLEIIAIKETRIDEHYMAYVLMVDAAPMYTSFMKEFPGALGLERSEFFRAAFGPPTVHSLS